VTLLLSTLLLLAGCGDKDGYTGSSGGVTDDGGTGDTGWPDDGDDEGTDEDGDGWTVEEGDCDDDDIYVNPARDEDTSDGKDNDCDGRTDEDFSGVAVIQIWYDGGPHTIHRIDTLGNISSTLEVDNDGQSYPIFLTEGVDGGYAALDWGTYAVVEIGDDGSVTTLSEFADDLKDGNIVYFAGITTHPDGYYLVGCGNALYAVESGSGARTLLAAWDYKTELFVYDLAPDPATGEVALFGYFGGFAIWDGQALDIRAPGGTDNPATAYLSAGAHLDGGGWYAMGASAEGYQVFELDEGAAQTVMDAYDAGVDLDKPPEIWVPQATWEGQWQPAFFTVDGDSGDYYISANAASYPTVWRIGASSGSQDLFYESEDVGSTNVTEMWDMFTLY
jgi:hypothetical protein